MKLAVRLVLATALAGAFSVMSAPAASANDCSNPKNPCRPCSVNLDFSDVRDIVQCYPT